MIIFARQVQPFGLSALGEVVGTVALTVAALVAAGILVAGFLAERRGTGRVSALSRWAARAADGRGPLWEPLPFGAVLAGLGLALLGWRALLAGGPVHAFGTDLVVLGLIAAMLGGVLAGALAHPPAMVAEHEPDQIAHPAPAHAVVRHTRLGAGPVSAPVIVVAGLVALLATPVAAAGRLVGGVAANDATAHQVVVTAVLVICAGAWGLVIEGRSAAAGVGVPRPRRVDVAEVAAGTSVLLAGSVLLDGGVPRVVVAAVGAVALVVVRARAGTGSAVLTAMAAIVLRLGAATLVWAFGAPVAPLAWQALLASVGIEAAAALLSVIGGRQLAGGASAPGSVTRSSVRS